jgi:pyruvate dehydrogenase E2 component (dihydrolipoamide acetyltransferase)
VIEVFVKPGDSIKVEQSLITVESDKASMEIPSSHAGVVEAVLVKLGDKVAKGSPIVRVRASTPLARGSCDRTGTLAGIGCGPVTAIARRRRLQPRRPAPATVPAHEPAGAPVPRACHMPRRRSASWRANSACRWPR